MKAKRLAIEDGHGGMHYASTAEALEGRVPPAMIKEAKAAFAALAANTPPRSMFYGGTWCPISTVPWTRGTGPMIKTED